MPWINKHWLCRVLIWGERQFPFSKQGTLQLSVFHCDPTQNWPSASSNEWITTVNEAQLLCRLDVIVVFFFLLMPKGPFFITFKIWIRVEIQSNCNEILQLRQQNDSFWRNLSTISNRFFFSVTQIILMTTRRSMYFLHLKMEKPFFYLLLKYSCYFD